MARRHSNRGRVQGGHAFVCEHLESRTLLSSVVTVSPSSTSHIAENGGGGSFLFFLSGTPVNVNYTFSGTATNGVDYGASGQALPTSQQVSNPYGPTALGFGAMDGHNAGYSPTLTLTLTLQSGSGYTIGSPSSASFTIDEAPPPPASPSATGGTRSVALSWSSSTTATSYNVYRGTTSGGETLLTSNVATTSYNDTGLSDGTTYYYKITGVGVGGEGDKSAEVSATTAVNVSSITVADNNSSATSTTTGLNGPSLTFYANNDGTGSLTLTAAVSPNTAAGYAATGYTLVNSSGVTIQSGALSQTGVTLALPAPPQGATSDTFTVSAGPLVNGVLNVTQSVPVKAVLVKLSDSTQSIAKAGGTVTVPIIDTNGSDVSGDTMVITHVTPPAGGLASDITISGQTAGQDANGNPARKVTLLDSGTVAGQYIVSISITNKNGRVISSAQITINAS